MPLPDVCPLDGGSACKHNECHLYHIDWRTGDENCSIGYRITAKTRSSRPPQQDTYAENTRRRLGRDFGSRAYKKPEPVEKEALDQELQERPSPEPEAEPEVVFREEVVSSNKDTTVIRSYNSSRQVDEKPSDKPKGKKVEDAMKLDLPENYEEEFWN